MGLAGFAEGLALGYLDLLLSRPFAGSIAATTALHAFAQ